jgi:23S rRNA (pseudouridine1915-N3)-methyltransferase
VLIRIIAVGTKMPAWVTTAVDDYSSRMPAEFALQWKEVKAEVRSASGTSTSQQRNFHHASRFGEIKHCLWQY